MATQKFWVATKEQLENAMLKQNVYERLKPIEDRFTAHCFFANQYCDYIDLVNRLGYLYHKTFQVQKRDLIERLLHAATQRLIELRNDLKKIELSEFIYIDRTLKQRKLTPFSIQIIRPEYFPYCRPKEINELIKNPRPPPPPTVEETLAEQKRKKMPANLDIITEKVLTDKELKIKNAAILIQSHERLRNCRIWQTNIRYNPKEYWPSTEINYEKIYKFTHRPDQEKLFPMDKTDYDQNYFRPDIQELTDFHFYEKKNKSLTSSDILGTSSVVYSSIRKSTHSEKEETGINDRLRKQIHILGNDDHFRQIRRENSAMIIQNAWRKYSIFKKYKREILNKKIMMGMVPRGKKPPCNIENTNEMNYNICQKVLKFKEDFIRAVENEKNRILIVRGPWIMEDISDQIRFWFKDFYDLHEEFHPFPEEIKGGTMLLLLDQTMDHIEFADFLKQKPLTKEQKQKIREKAKKQRKKEREYKKKQLQKEKQFMKNVAAKGGVYYDMKKILPPNKNTTQIKEAIKEVKTKWGEVNENANRFNAPYMEFIRPDKFAEVHKELRVVVDNLMRIEYELLRKALCKDKKRKYRKPKVKKPKKGKKKRGKKQPIDITADRTISSLYYEMEDSGLIRSYTKHCFEEFVGDLNFCAYELKNFFGLEVLPSSLEVRDILREWVFGMGPLNITKKIKSLCLAGSPKSGKMLLCEILASELDAVIIDLSPEIVKKYEDDLNYLIHLVNKMSRLLQPTVILIKDVHRVFWKKIPPDSIELNPTLLQSLLIKQIIKPIKDDDKVFVIGTTNEPWSGKPKMKKAFEKILLLPEPNYGSSYLLWKELSLKYHGVPKDLEFSPIAWVAKTYTSGKIKDTIEKTLTIDRRTQFKRKPLKSEELIETLIEQKHFPPQIEDSAKYIKWNSKANKLERERARYLKIINKKNAKAKPK